MKVFIVRGLAHYGTPSDVAEAVRVNFGVEITRQQVHAYDPACRKPPAQRWRDLHAATRQAYLKEMSGIGVAQKAFRLRMLDRMARASEERNRLVLAAGFLEQAAKECGGIYERSKRAMRVRPR
jgi:hypothetical protein